MKSKNKINKIINYKLKDLDKDNIITKDDVYLWFFNKPPTKNNLFYQLIKKVDIGFNKTKDIFNFWFIDIENKNIWIFISKHDNNIDWNWIIKKIKLYLFSFQEENEIIRIINVTDKSLLEIYSGKENHWSAFYFDFQIRISRKNLYINLFDFWLNITYQFIISRKKYKVESYVFPQNNNIITSNLEINGKKVEILYRINDFNILFNVENLKDSSDINNLLDYIKENRLENYNLFFKNKKIFIYKTISLNKEDNSDYNFKKSLELLILDNQDGYTKTKENKKMDRLDNSINNTLDNEIDWTIDDWDL